MSERAYLGNVVTRADFEHGAKDATSLSAREVASRRVESESPRRRRFQFLYNVGTSCCPVRRIASRMWSKDYVRVQRRSVGELAVFECDCFAQQLRYWLVDFGIALGKSSGQCSDKCIGCALTEYQ